MTTKVKGDLTDTQDFLLTFFEEKDLPFKFWTLTDKAGDTHMLNSDFIIDLTVFETTEEERKKIQKHISYIDFKNGDVNQYLRDLAQMFIDARVDQGEDREEDPYYFEYVKPYNRVVVKDRETDQEILVIRGKDIGKVFHNEFDSEEHIFQYIAEEFGESIEEKYE